MKAVLLFITTASLAVWAQRPPGLSEVTYDAREDYRFILMLEQPSLHQMLQRAKKSGQSPTRSQIQAHQAQLTEAQDRVVAAMNADQIPAKVMHRFGRLINGMTVSISGDQAWRLKRLPGVARVVRDLEVQAHTGSSIPLVGADQAWLLKDGKDRFLRGQGTMIAILDTGVDYTHPDLGGGFGPGYRVVGGYDFINNDADPMDDHSHGTHVAGIAAGNGVVVGVAPEAKILAYKVLSGGGSGSTSVIVQGIEAAVDPDGNPLTDDGADVINLSLGGPGGLDDPITLACQAAVEAGVVVVASAGNDGISEPMGSPAVTPEAITVASVDKDLSIAYYTTRGPGPEMAAKPDIAAPGTDISSALPGGGYGLKSGTSMAAPHVAGAAALMIQRFPEMTPAQIKTRLMSLSDTLDEGHLERGSGLLQLAKMDQTPPLEIAYPAMSFGEVDLEASVYQAPARLTLRNHTDADVVLTPALTSAPQGISMNLPETLTVPAGEAVNFDFDFVLDNAVTPFPNNRLMVAQLLLELTADGLEPLKIQGFYRKGIKWSWQPEIQGDQTALLYNHETQFSYAQKYNSDLVELYMPPGEYNIVTIASTFFEEAFPKVYIDAQPLTATTANLVHQPGTTSLLEFEVTQENGALLDLSKTESNGSINFRWPAGAYNMGFAGFPHIPMHASVTDPEISLLYQNYARLEDDNVHVGYEWYGEKVNPPDAPIAVHMSDMKRTTWRWFPHSTEAHHTPILMALGDRSGRGIAPGVYMPGRGPFTYTTYDPVPTEAQLGNPYYPSRRVVWDLLNNQESMQYIVTGKNSMVVYDERNRQERLDVGTLDLDIIDLGLSPQYPLSTMQFKNGSTWVNGPLYWTVSDGLGNLLQSPSGFLVHVAPDGAITRYQDLENVITYLVPVPGEHELRYHYNNLLRGQASPAVMTHRFTIQNNSADDPPLLKHLALMGPKGPVDVFNGEETLVFTLEHGPGDVTENLSVAFDLGDGWQDVPVTVLSHNRFSAVPPSGSDGGTVNLRINYARETSSFELLVHDAFIATPSRVLPWVTANDTWRSRVALTNLGDSETTVTLIARDREQNMAKAKVMIPPGTVKSWDAGSIFDLNGYSLTVMDPSGKVYPSFLTLTQKENGIASPAQAAAFDLTTPSDQLSFGNIKRSEIPAIVVSAPFASEDRTTTLTIVLRNRLYQEYTVQRTLTGAFPLAATVSDLFGDGTYYEDAWIEVNASDGTRLAGAAFTFNQTLEPSMTLAETRQRQPGTLYLPWVVSNERWESEITLGNPSNYRQYLTVEAYDRNGIRSIQELILSNKEVRVVSASDLFPGLDSYALNIKASINMVTASLRTINKETPSGDSPAQQGPIHADERAPKISFSYLAGDQLPAVVLLAPASTGEVMVNLQLLGESGVLEEATVAVTGKVPYASLVTDLFGIAQLPKDVAVIAESPDDHQLIGVGFTFNQDGEPSMAKASPVRE